MSLLSYLYIDRPFEHKCDFKIYDEWSGKFLKEVLINEERIPSKDIEKLMKICLKRMHHKFLKLPEKWQASGED